MKPVVNEQNTLPYAESMGPYDYPADLLVKTRDLPIGEQTRYLCIAVTDIRNGKKSGGHRSLYDALNFGGVVVDKGLVVGIFRTEGAQLISLLGQEQEVYSAVETDGAGENTLDSYETVCGAPAGDRGAYYTQYVVPGDVARLTAGTLPYAQRYVLGGGVRAIDKDAFPNRSATLYYQGDLEQWLALSGKENVVSRVVLWDEDGRPRTHIDLPDGTQTLGTYAFINCQDLVQVTLCDTLRTIGKDAFEGAKVSRIDYRGSVAGWLALGGKENLDGDVYLWDEAGAAVTAIRIPDGQTAIPAHAFARCKQVQCIDVPDSVRTIGAWAFAYTAIPSVHIPDGVTVLDTGALCGCEQLAQLTLPEGLTTIGNWALQGTAALTQLTLPPTVHEVGIAALQSSGLVALHLTALPAVLGKDVLAHTPASLQIRFHGTPQQWLTPCQGRENLNATLCFDPVAVPDGVLRIPDGVAAIPPYAFVGLAEVEALELPSSVKSIGASAFQNSTLRRVSLGNIEQIDDMAFWACKHLVEVDLPDGLTSIGDRAFDDCSALQRIYIPATVQRMGDGVFLRCTRRLSVRCGASSLPDGWSTHWNVRNVSTLSRVERIEWKAKC